MAKMLFAHEMFKINVIASSFHFDADFSAETVTAFAKRKPSYTVFRDPFTARRLRRHHL